jgi:hypothetical protein
VDIADIWIGADDNVAIQYDYDPHVAGAGVLRSNAKRHVPVSVLKLLNMEASRRELSICRPVVDVKGCITVFIIVSTVIGGTRHFS